MEVVPLVGGGGAGGGGGGGGALPFAHRDVQEWSRVDRLTGTREHARVETDRWAARSATSSHQYGKRVDNRTRELPGGGGQQRSSSQVEVFESREQQRRGTGPGVRVVRKQTLTTSSTSSTIFRSASATLAGGALPDFDSLQLTFNPLDVSSEKSRGSVGRSGSIGGRRPPSRPRSLAPLPDDASLERGSSVEELVENTSSLGLINNPSSGVNGDVEIPISMDSYHPKARRSLQFSPVESSPSLPTPPPDSANIEDEFPIKGSVIKMRKALEERRLEALEGVLRRGANIADSVKLDGVGDGDEESSLAALLARPKPVASNSSPKQRHSFVTVESLKEVREKLRRTSGGTDTDDDAGIVVSDPAPRVRSYVFGMPQGTGSLESRTSNRSSSSGGSRSEEWYNRRKSYGFEKVHTSTNETTSLGPSEGGESGGIFSKKPQREASTDSGICRSTEQVGGNKIEEIRRQLGLKTSNLNNSCVQIKPGGTVVTLGPQPSTLSNQPKVVTIPIVPEDDSTVSNAMRGQVDNRRLFFQQLAKGTSLSVESTSKVSSNDIKRHSIAVDESKYVKEGVNKNNLTNGFLDPIRRHSNIFDSTSLDDEINHISTTNWSEEAARKKRVEFCKTEVHFAAESGRFNLVETDEKPPPTNMFRRRRRNAAAAATSAAVNEAIAAGLPELRFGDSHYEKKLLCAPTESPPSPEPKESISLPIKTNISPQNLIPLAAEDDDNSDDKPRGILKTRPKSFMCEDRDETSRWGGVKLRHVQEATWRSPVARPATVQEPSSGEIVTKGRSASWSVADRVRHVEKLTAASISPPYSTKVHIGDSTTSVETSSPSLPSQTRLYHSFDRSKPIWQRRENMSKDSLVSDTKPNLSKSLILRIGKIEDEPSSSSSTPTKTTKITIDLTPSPSACKSSCLQSPSLILQTFKTAAAAATSLPTTTSERGSSEEMVVGSTVLAAWKERYFRNEGDEDEDDDHNNDDDSADEEVRSYMSGGCGDDGSDADAEGSSIVSGSWNRVMASEIARDYRRHITQDTSGRIEMEKKQHQHCSMKTAMVSSYSEPNESRLRSVETLVSTAQGRPKITSISLRYDDPEDENYLKETENLKSNSLEKQGTVVPKIEISSNNEYKHKMDAQSIGIKLNKSPKCSPNSSLTKNTNINDRNFNRNKFTFESTSLIKNNTNNKINEEYINKGDKNKSYEFDNFRKTYTEDNNKIVLEKQQTYGKKYFGDSNKASVNNRFISLSPEISRKSPSRTFIDGNTPSSLEIFSKKNENTISSKNSLERKTQSTEKKTENNSKKINLETTQMFKYNASNKYEKNMEQTSEKLINKEIKTNQKKIESTSPRKPIDSSTFVRRKSKTTSSPTPIDSGTFTRQRGRKIDSRTLPVHRGSAAKEQTKVVDEQEKEAHLYVNGHVMSSVQQQQQQHIYENQDAMHRAREFDTESAIMEELTKAADDILKAVNGYTDEESFRASSDDEPGRRLGNKARAGPLATINESPSGKGDASKTSTPRRSIGRSALALPRQSRSGGASSTSSLDSVSGPSTSPPRRSQMTVSSSYQSSKTSSSRAARLIQRASSRELLLSANASSSEDVATDTAAASISAAAAASAQLRRQRANTRRSRPTTTPSTNITSAQQQQQQQISHSNRQTQIVSRSTKESRLNVNNSSSSKRRESVNGVTNRHRGMEIKHSEAKHMMVKVSEKSGVNASGGSNTTSSRKSNGSLHKTRETSSTSRAKMKKVPFK